MSYALIAITTANPNWPSKTGQSSGGGRGNNPPKAK
jgi:hypothetical protein